jgi:FkbM family methyltransferase
MRHYLDLGTHKFEGLEEFIKKFNLGANDNIYCFEPNKQIYEISRQDDKVALYEQKFHSFKHYNAAIMNYTGVICFNSHDGAWLNGTFVNDYTMGSNCLEINPNYDAGNGAIFNIVSQESNCVDIEELVSSIVMNDSDAEIYIKCDIEGSEFVVLPKLLSSNYINHVKIIYIEWHERFWYGTLEYENKVNEKNEIIANFESRGIEAFTHG